MARRFTKNTPSSALTSLAGQVSSANNTDILVGSQWAIYAVSQPGSPALVTEIEPDDTEETGPSLFITSLASEQHTPPAAHTVTSEAFGTGNGVLTSFTHTAADVPVKVGTVALYDNGVLAAKDDTLGNIVGVYGEPITGESVGTGDGTTRTFTHTAAKLPVKPGSVTVTAGAVTGTDNGSGVITGTGVSGTINYQTGAVSVTYSVAPVLSLAITMAYQQAVTVSGTVNYATGAMAVTFTAPPVNTHPLTVNYATDPTITVTGPLPDPSKVVVMAGATLLTHGTGSGKWLRSSGTEIVLGTPPDGSTLYTIVYGVSATYNESYEENFTNPENEEP